MADDDEDDQLDDSAIGDGNYVVKPGDCLSKIAAAFGFDWQTLWNLPENAELKRQRKDPNVLYPGDQLFVPELRLKELDAATDQVHTYRLKGTPAKVRLRFLEDGEPRAGESYILIIDGAGRSGTLDSEGRLEEPIPPEADSVTIIIADEHPIVLKLGSVDPVNTISGVQGRLSNLGFPRGLLTTKWVPRPAAPSGVFRTSTTSISPANRTTLPRRSC